MDDRTHKEPHKALKTALQANKNDGKFREEQEEFYATRAMSVVSVLFSNIPACAVRVLILTLFETETESLEFPLNRSERTILMQLLSYFFQSEVGFFLDQSDQGFPFLW